MTVSVTPVNNGTTAGDGTGEGAFDAFESVNANEANFKAAIEELQGRFWTLDDTARSLAVGERVVSETHAGITHTLPATFALSATALSDVWVWNADSNSAITLAPTTGDQIFLTGTGQGVSASITLSPGQLAICSPRVANTSWDVHVVTDWSSGAATAPLTTTGALTCGALTSTGIDDNATGERLQIADSLVTVGPSDTATYSIGRVLNTGSLAISGGTNVNVGAHILMYGGAHATVANDIRFRANSLDELYYDDSASTWDFSDNDLITGGNLVPDSGKGIDFAAAGGNVFNLYDEGTFTPVLSDLTNNATASTAIGHVTKVGRLRFIQIRMSLTSLGSVSGDVYITGLPDTIKSDSSSSGCWAVVVQNANLAAAGYSIVAIPVQNSTTALLQTYDATGGCTTTQASELTATLQVYITGQYVV